MSMQQNQNEMTWSEIARLQKSEDYVDRFEAEFYALQKRLVRLDNMLYCWRNNSLNFEPNCSYRKLKDQFDAMLKYYDILVDRAEIEHIELNATYR